MIIREGITLPQKALILRQQPEWKCRYAFDPNTGILYWEAAKDFRLYGNAYGKGWHARHISISISVDGKNRMYKLSDLWPEVVKI